MQKSSESHNIHTLDVSDGEFKKHLPLSYLIDARLVDRKPLKKDGVPVYFTETNKAAQYLSAGQNINAAYVAQPVPAKTFLDFDKVIIDPCAHCGFENFFEVKSFKTHDDFYTAIAKVIASTQQRLISLMTSANEQLEKGLYKEAVEIAKTGLQHLMPAHAEFHYVLALCGQRLGDIMMEKAARQNLEKHAPQLLLTLKK